MKRGEGGLLAVERMLLVNGMTWFPFFFLRLVMEDWVKNPMKTGGSRDHQTCDMP